MKKFDANHSCGLRKWKKISFKSSKADTKATFIHSCVIIPIDPYTEI